MPYQIENRKYAFTASNIHRLLLMPHIHSHLEIIYLIKGSSIAVRELKELFQTKMPENSILRRNKLLSDMVSCM